MSKRENHMLVTNDMIIAEALSWQGTPYLHQASCKEAGCDCLGLIRGVYRAFWGEPEIPPAYSPDWAEAGGKETLAMAARRHLLQQGRDELEPGNVVLFRWRANCPAKHAAIMLPDQKMIHAQNGSAVTVTALSDWWKRRIAYVFAFPSAKQASSCQQGQYS